VWVEPLPPTLPPFTPPTLPLLFVLLMLPLLVACAAVKLAMSASKRTDFFKGLLLQVVKLEGRRCLAIKTTVERGCSVGS
jgi:hypothetical protein